MQLAVSSICWLGCQGSSTLLPQGKAGTGSGILRTEWWVLLCSGCSKGQGDQCAQGKTWWWHTGGPGKVLQLNWVMEGCPQGAHTPCRVSGHRAAWLCVGQGWGEWGWHTMAWLLACTSWGAQLSAAIPWVGHVPGYWVAGAGGDRNKHWVLACGRWSARPAHVCCSRVRPRPLLPRPQMVARKRRPVPPPSVHHHVSLAPWPLSPARMQG